MSEDRKRISIASSAPLVTYGGIMGPIRRPFYETISNISILISEGAEVYEHIGNKKIKLNMVNFDCDNSVEETATPVAARTVEATKEAEAERIIKISANSNNRAQQNQNDRNRQKEKFYKEKVQSQVKETVVDTIVEE